MNDEMTDEQLRAMYEDYKTEIAGLDELESPKIIDPNGPEELLDTPETTTEIFSGDPITCE